MYDKKEKRLTGWRLKLSKCFIIPQRYVLGIMGFLAIVNAYNMRICLSVAIVDMTLPTAKDENKTNIPDSCPMLQAENVTITKDSGRHEYAWSSSMQGTILSSFFWGYVVTHMPGGILAEKFGGKHSLGLGILSTAIFTLLTPVVIRHFDWPGLVTVRVIEGLGEGTTYPALNALLAQWVPLNERAKIGTLVYAGGQIGTIMGNAISGALIEYTNSWESVFYLFGFLGLLWFVIWCCICFSDPESHPFISDEELEYLVKEIGSNRSKRSDKFYIPWKDMATSVPLWALIAAQIGHDWGFFTLVTDLPIYMSEILKYDIKTNGMLSSVPYVGMWIVSMGSGWLCDWMIEKNMVSISFARKLFTTIASTGPAIFIIAASYAGCDRTIVIVLFCIGVGLMGTFYPGMKVNALDLAPNYAGTIMAIVNGIGAFTGIITPLLVGEVTTDHTIEQWRIVFWIAFCVFMVTNVIFIFFGSADTQPWNDPHKKAQDIEKARKKSVQSAVMDKKPSITA